MRYNLEEKPIKIHIIAIVKAEESRGITSGKIF